MIFRWTGASFCAAMSCVLAMFLSAADASAHRLNETYVYFSVTEDALTGRFEATTRDLSQLMPLDMDADGAISLPELQARQSEIFTLFAERLALWDETRPLPVVPADLKILTTPQGDFAQIGFAVPDLQQVPSEIGIAYRPLSDVLTPGHLGFGLIENNTRTGIKDNEGHVALVFNPGDGRKTLHLSGEPFGAVFRTYAINGVRHILGGFDHLIFLVALMLPAVMAAGTRPWAPRTDATAAILHVGGLVLVLSIACAASLIVATSGAFALPLSLVEVVITLAIIAAALINLAPERSRFILGPVLAFGLVHGFGIPNLLAPLGEVTGPRIAGLAGFNLGFLMAQLAIIAIAFPILWLLRNWSLYPPLAFRLGSLALIALAGVWLFERSTGIIWDLRAAVLQSLGLA